MVLGISLRRKKKEDTTDDNEKEVPSPTLPVLAPSAFQWPSNFIADNGGETPSKAHSSPGREPIRQHSASNIPYHRPFRKDSFTSLPGNHQQPHQKGTGTIKAGGTDSQGRPSIASIYASQPLASFRRTQRNSTVGGTVRPSRNKRRTPHVVPTFNVMVVGGARTGKTSISRLLLQTCHLSPLATPAHHESLDKFMQGPVKRTDSVETATVQVDEGSERIALTLMDTPGLQLGNELDLERSVTTILRLFDTRFAETLNEENKVDRRNKGDQHVHLCIYLIAPDAVKVHPSRTPNVPAISKLPPQHKATSPAPPNDSLTTPEDASSSEAALASELETPELTDTSSPESRHSNLATPVTSDGTDTPKASDNQQVRLSDADIYVIKRLSTRVNVLPIISHADTLTDERLEEIKMVVRRDLKNGGVQISGVLSQLENADDSDSDESDDDEDEDEEGSRTPRHVVRIRPTNPTSPTIKRQSSFVGRSRSRSRAALTDEDIDFGTANTIFPKGVESMRALFPFAVMAPDPVPSRPVTTTHGNANGTNEKGMNPAGIPVPATPPPSSFRRKSITLDSEDILKDMRGKYTRKYRWGSVDVLNPEHCDFLALRHAILGPRMRVLKETTNEVLYENYRTQKLIELKSLSRRGTNAATPTSAK